jgi:hypothetical protein
LPFLWLELRRLRRRRRLWNDTLQASVSTNGLIAEVSRHLGVIRVGYPASLNHPRKYGLGCAVGGR